MLKRFKCFVSIFMDVVQTDNYMKCTIEGPLLFSDYLLL